MAITVSISRQDLMREEVCYSGLKLFDQIKALQDEQRAAEGMPEISSLEVQWTPLHALLAAIAYPSVVAWLTDRGLIPRVNLAWADLSWAYLARANLSGAFLAGANLDGADLARAYLYGADLTGADLCGARLDGANLARAELRGANLARANLAQADLTRADLTGARRRRTDPALDGWEVVGAECDCCVYLRR